ncbi:MAG: hypothetical protein AAGA48_40960 [Myxococcota bacterium]
MFVALIPSLFAAPAAAQSATVASENISHQLEAVGRCSAAGETSLATARRRISLNGTLAQDFVADMQSAVPPTLSTHAVGGVLLVKGTAGIATEFSSIGVSTTSTPVPAPLAPSTFFATVTVSLADGSLSSTTLSFVSTPSVTIPPASLGFVKRQSITIDHIEPLASGAFDALDPCDVASVQIDIAASALLTAACSSGRNQARAEWELFGNHDNTVSFGIDLAGCALP